MSFPLSPLQAYELSTLTGTQVLLLVASETGHVYTFATRKLQPMITSETGKALIQTCLNSPDSPPRSDPSMDQRMSATGFEETDLTYQVSESESMGDTKVRTAGREGEPSWLSLGVCSSMWSDAGAVTWSRSSCCRSACCLVETRTALLIQKVQNPDKATESRMMGNLSKKG